MTKKVTNSTVSVTNNTDVDVLIKKILKELGFPQREEKPNNIKSVRTSSKLTRSEARLMIEEQFNKKYGHIF